MFTSSFPEKEIAHYIDMTTDFIKSQREIFGVYGEPLLPEQLKPFRPFFNDNLLKTTKFFHKKDGPIRNPEFLEDLNRRGLEFSLINTKAITFQDVVVSFEELEPQVLFHELVHVVQYQKLGFKQFANKYVRGLLRMGSYKRIPLEANAFLLDESFVKNPFTSFSVEIEVQKWINDNRF